MPSSQDLLVLGGMTLRGLTKRMPPADRHISISGRIGSSRTRGAATEAEAGALVPPT
jgi:hypothetical protein